MQSNKSNQIGYHIVVNSSEEKYADSFEPVVDYKEYFSGKGEVNIDPLGSGLIRGNGYKKISPNHLGQWLRQNPAIFQQLNFNDKVNLMVHLCNEDNKFPAVEFYEEMKEKTPIDEFFLAVAHESIRQFGAPHDHVVVLLYFMKDLCLKHQDKAIQYFADTESRVDAFFYYHGLERSRIRLKDLVDNLNAVNFFKFCQRHFGKYYYHNKLTPLEKVELIAKHASSFATLSTLGELKKILVKSRISLYQLAKSDPVIKTIIFKSEVLSLALERYQLDELRLTAKEDEKNIAVRDNNDKRDIVFLKDDIKEILEKIKKIIADNLVIFNSLLDAKQEIKGNEADAVKGLYGALVKAVDKELDQLNKISFLDSEMLIDFTKKCAMVLNDAFQKNQGPVRFKLVKISQDYLGKYFDILNKIKHYLELDYPRISYEAQHFWRIRKAFIAPPTPPGVNPPIPKIIHYHWVGGPIPIEYVNNILRTQKYAPDHQIILWTDNPDRILKNIKNFNSDIVINDKAKGFGNVRIRDVQELLKIVKDRFVTPEVFKKIQAFIVKESGRGEQSFREGNKKAGYYNFACVADLTRLLGLLVMGGIYMDTDVKATLKFELQEGHYGFLHTPHDNNVMLSTENHPIIRDAIIQLLNRYEMINRTRIYRYEQVVHKEYDSAIFDQKILMEQAYSVNDLRRFFYKIPGISPVKLFSKPDAIHERSIGAWPDRRGLLATISGDQFDEVAAAYQAEYLLIDNNNGFEFTGDGAGRHPVPPELSETFANSTHIQYLNFGGIYVLCDQTWVTDETRKFKDHQNLAVNSEEKPKPKPRSRGFSI